MSNFKYQILNKISKILPFQIGNWKLKIENSQSAFTLVELLVYMGIFSILLFVLMQLFTGILATHAESQATSSLAEDGNVILSRLTYDIRRASSISSPTTYGTPGQQLSLSISGNTYTYQYDSSNKVLTVSLNGGTPAILDSYGTSVAQATDVRFTLLGNSAAGSKPSIQINLKLSSTTIRPGATTPQTETFETTIQTR